MPAPAGELYDYLMGLKSFSLKNEGQEYQEGKVKTDVARFEGPSQVTVEIMVHASGFQTVNLYKGGVPIVVDNPALLDPDVFKVILNAAPGVRKK